MADNTQLNLGSGGDVIATDEIAGVKHQRVKVEFGADGSATDVSPLNGLPTDLALDDPQSSYGSVASVAAGASADIDSTQITTAKTGRLVAVVVGASVPVKAVLHAVTNAVAGSALAVGFTPAGESKPMPIPSKKFFAVAHDAGAGFDGFRLTVTNLDTTQVSDIHATFYWDE